MTIDRDEGRIGVVHCPAIAWCITVEAAMDEALAHVTKAIKLSRELRAEPGLPLTSGTRRVERARGP